MRAAGRVYGEIGDRLSASKAEDVAALEDQLRAEATEVLTVVKPLIGQVTETLALRQWHNTITPNRAPTFARVTEDGRVIDQALGTITSVLLRLIYDLTEVEQERETEEVPA
jgi:hypothetical protein